MEKCSVSDIARALGTAWTGTAEVSSLCTDSREAAPGSLFVAIPGERVDGHDFVSKALAQGATCALVERPGDYPPEKTLLVPNTVEAMLTLAAWYRSKFSPKVVGVTGSVGKTTTKDMIAAVLSARFRTIKTIGNQNNEIGAPRTLLSIGADTQAAVVEMGMCGFGEIRALAQAAKPDVGVITNIGVSHLEQLGTRENILKAKLELADCLPDGAPLFLCGDNDLLSGVKIPRLRVIFYGLDKKDCAIGGMIQESTPTRTTFLIRWQGREYPAQVPGAGKHLVLNALAAFGIGVELGMTPEEAVAALEHYVPSGMRQHVVEKGGLTVVEDCYNASPDSVKAALDAMKDFPCQGRRIAVLSDMLELGSQTVQGHRDCGRRAAEDGVDALFLFGDQAEEYAAGARDGGLEEIRILPDREALAQALLQAAGPGDLIWFKASHSMRLEETIELFYQGLEEQAAK